MPDANGSLSDQQVSFQSFSEEWLSDIREGNPSTLELGRRFAHKLITQWKDIDPASDDIVFCDGSGDGGIDVALLERLGGDSEEPESTGDSWYLVQSKFGTAFQGAQTLLSEGLKIIDTLDGRRDRLSSLTEGLLERLRHFRSNASHRDRIVVVFATEEPLNTDQRRLLTDLQVMGKERLGSLFEVESVSIEIIYKRMLEAGVADRVKVPLSADLVASGGELLIGSTPLMKLYSFLKAYRSSTDDLDQLYERNVRKFLGLRGKVNKAIQKTLEGSPERFGLFNNGITIVVQDFARMDDGALELIEPFVVNGCQTTRTIWEVFQRRMEAGGTGENKEMADWKAKAEHGVVVTKVVKVGVDGEYLLEQITRHTNTQNAIREKDFLALTTDFRNWAKAMEDQYGVYLEIQRGGWDSRRALQKQQPAIKQFAEAAHANAFDLLKVYGAGWFGEPGTAFGKNAPFLPNGSVFKRIMNGDTDDGERFGCEDLYAGFLLQKAANGLGFGRGSQKPSRRQTRFLFYMVLLDLVKDILSWVCVSPTPKKLSHSILRLYQAGREDDASSLTEIAGDTIDRYLTQGMENCVFDEPAFKTTHNFDLNGFLKWERLGKSEADTPRLRNLLAVTKMVMGQKVGGSVSLRDRLAAAIKA